MRTIVYILGLLRRLGPQHGYQIKKYIQAQLADFTHLKLPVIYYHLERMEKAGWVRASAGKAENRPPKTVYALTPRGRKHFETHLRQLAKMSYQTDFDSDAVFYFSDSLDPGSLVKNLTQHGENLRAALAKVQLHRKVAFDHLPEQARQPAAVIFNHHRRHMQAELDWAEETIKILQHRK
jgi:DNA-binding PadR family transcriptional regulator